MIDCKLKLIDNSLDFKKIKPLWSDLLRNSSTSKSIFQSFEWNFNWWKNYSQCKNLFIICVFDKTRLIGIVPLYIEYKHVINNFKVRLAKFIGNNSSDYLDFIICKGSEKKVMETFINFVDKNDVIWDYISLKDIPSESPVASYLSAKKVGHNLLISNGISSFYPKVKLPENFDHYMASLSRKSRKNFRRELRTLRDNFNLDFRSINNYGNGNLESFIELNQSRWSAKDGNGPFDSDEFRLFHEMLSKDNNFSKSVIFFNLHLDNKLVCSIYTFTYSNNIYFYQIGYDSSYSKYSIGRVGLLLSIEHSINKKLTYFDFLRGQEDYKYKFGVLEGQSDKFLIGNRTGNLSKKLYKLKLFYTKIMETITKNHVQKY